MATIREFSITTQIGNVGQEPMLRLLGNEGESLKTLILIPSPRIVSGDPPIVAG
jgi:hypothetical protein